MGDPPLFLELQRLKSRAAKVSLNEIRVSRNDICVLCFGVLCFLRLRLWQQTLEFPQGGEEPGPQAGHDDCADSTEDHGGHGSEPMRGEARFELAQFVGRADEN